MATAPGGERALARHGSVLASRLVGRDVEVAALGDALEQAVRGHGGVVFLGGEPGIGKSRLARTVAAHAEGRGLAVLRGRAVPGAAPVAYRPFAEALCAAVRSGVVSDEAPGLTLFRPMLGWLIPEWRADEAPPGDSVMALAEAVLRLLRVAAGRQGCLLLLEDLHWADPETLRVVEYLADNLADERVLCLATVRDEGRSAGLDLSRALHARRVSRAFALPRLTRQEVADMAADCLGADSLPDEVLELAERADGVPFLVEELLATARMSGALVLGGASWARAGTTEPIVPVTFSDSMRRRLSALGEATRAVLPAAAVLGRAFDWSLLPAIAERDEPQVLTALRAAVDAQILVVDHGAGTFRFRHALSRDALLAQLLPPERVALSRRALGAVEAAHPGLEGDWCELAAGLAEGAGERGRAGMLLLEAGRRSLDGGALASAEAALDRARSLVDAGDPAMLDIDECLCHVLSLAGKRDRALEVGAALLARLREDPGAAGRRAEVYIRLARAALAATHADEAASLLARARAEVAAAPDEALTARLDALAAQVAIVVDPDHAPALARAAVEAAERLGFPDVACEALEVLGRSERLRDVESAERFFSRALALAEAHGLTVWRTRALHELGTIDLLRGAPVSRLQEARDLAFAQGAFGTAAVVDVQIAAAQAVLDDPEPGAVAARRSSELARRYGMDQTQASAVALEAHVHARAGRTAEMQRCIEQAHALAPGSADVEMKTSFAAAMQAFLVEDRASARRHLTASVAHASAGPGAGLLALLRQVDGPAGTATPVAEDAVHFIACAFHRYARAVEVGRGHDHARASALVAEGDRALEGHLWLRHLGRRLLAEAALADGWGEPVPWLREALDFFEQRGERHIASACRSLLRRAGAPVPRRRGEDDMPGPLRAAGVTPRELEVLRLLATGLPNREIAARLYLSPRTVERHVANAAAKVAVAGRSELIAYAARTLGNHERAEPDRKP